MTTGYEGLLLLIPLILVLGGLPKHTKRKHLWLLLALALTFVPAVWSAFQTIYGLWIPIVNENTNAGAQTILIDAAAEKVAFVGIMSKTCTLDRLGFWLHTVSTGDTLKCSFQNVDLTTGFPDGTVDQLRTVVIGGGDGNKWIDPSTSPALGVITSDGTDTGVKRSVTAGDIVAGVCEYNAFVAGSMNFGLLEHIGGVTSGWRGGAVQNVYMAGFTAAWAMNVHQPVFAFGCSDNTWQYTEGAVPVTGLDQGLAFNVDTVAQDEVALRFKIPFRAKLGQAKIFVTLAGNADAVLYDGASNPSFSLDKDLRKVTGNTVAVAQFNDVTLEADTVYRLSLKPTTTTNVTITYSNYQQNALLVAQGGNVDMYWSTRVNGGAWTDLTTRRPFISLGFSQIDAASAGGGGASSFVARLLGPLRPDHAQP